MTAGGPGRSQPAGPVLAAGRLHLSSPGGAPIAASLPLGTATLGLEESLPWPLGGSLALALWMPLCRQGLGLWSREPLGRCCEASLEAGLGADGLGGHPPRWPPRALPASFLSRVLSTSSTSSARDSPGGSEAASHVGFLVLSPQKSASSL